MMRVVVVAVLLASCRDLASISPTAPGNAAPFADAGVGSKYDLGTGVQLDGSRSFDPDGDLVSFEWTVIARPPGSTARPADPAAATTTFVPDRYGMYRLQLSVIDDGGRSDTSDIWLEVGGQLRVDAGPDRSIPWFQPTQLHGVVTTLAPVTPTFEWKIEQQPSGAIATLRDATTLDPTLFADVDGEYVLRLTARGGGEEVVDRVKLTATPASAPVGSNILDYEYSLVLHRVIAATTSGTVLLVDPASGVTATLSTGLSTMARAFAFDDSNQRVVIGGPGQVALVNLMPLQLVRLYPVNLQIADMVFGPDGRVHCIPADGQSEPIASLDLATGDVVTVPSPGRFMEAVTAGYEMPVVETGSTHTVIYELGSDPIFIFAQQDFAGISAPLFRSLTSEWFVTGNGFVIRDRLEMMYDLNATVRAAGQCHWCNQLAVATPSQLQFHSTFAFALFRTTPLPHVGGASIVPRFLAYDLIGGVTRFFLAASTPAGDVVITGEAP